MFSLAEPQRPPRLVPDEVWWILFVGAVLRVTFFFLGENNGGDALARASMTAGWVRHSGSWLNFEPWLSLHFWLMAGLSRLAGGPSFGGRVFPLRPLAPLTYPSGTP